jgi:hypothetical protein
MCTATDPAFHPVLLGSRLKEGNVDVSACGSCGSGRVLAVVWVDTCDGICRPDCYEIHSAWLLSWPDTVIMLGFLVGNHSGAHAVIVCHVQTAPLLIHWTCVHTVWLPFLAMS